MYNSAIPKKAWINLISKPIETIHKVWEGCNFWEQPHHEFFHHAITPCHKLQIFEKNEVLWTSNHVQGCNSQKSMDKPHLQTYCDHAQSLARFYFCGTAISWVFPPCHHLMSQAANYWKKLGIMGLKSCTSCNSQKSMDKPHLQTYCDHSQRFARFYLCGTAISWVFPPWHHLMSQTANFWKKRRIMGLKSCTKVQFQKKDG